MNKIYQKIFPEVEKPAVGRIGGFTLIELLVVVLIIGILSAIALPQYTKAVEKSRLTEGLIQGRALLNAQQMFVLSNGRMTADLSELDIGVSSDWHCLDDSGIYCGYYPPLGAKKATLEVSEWNTAKPYLWCIAKTDLGKSLCRSFGGEAHHIGSGEHAGVEYYLVYK